MGTPYVLDHRVLSIDRLALRSVFGTPDRWESMAKELENTLAALQKNPSKGDVLMRALHKWRRVKWASRPSGYEDMPRECVHDEHVVCSCYQRVLANLARCGLVRGRPKSRSKAQMVVQRDQPGEPCGIVDLSGLTDKSGMSNVEWPIVVRENDQDVLGATVQGRARGPNVVGLVDPCSVIGSEREVAVLTAAGRQGQDTTDFSVRLL